MNSGKSEIDAATWENVDWNSLKRLRQVFVQAAGGVSEYWDNELQLESYHATLGERIGWKWDAVIRELDSRGIPVEGGLTDWGCGTGIASLRALRRASAGRTLALWDHSPLSTAFAARAVRKEFPEVDCRVLSRAPESADVLLVSHVLNELRDDQLPPLLGLIRKSRLAIWVENGSQANSRRLSKFRDLLTKADAVAPGPALEALAPCLDSVPCKMLSPGNENEWCHSFASIPSEVHQDPKWRLFSQKLGVDLRSLSYSFAVFGAKTASSVAVEGLVPGENLYRLIGRPREYKGYAKLLTCRGQHGVFEFILQKRDAPDLFKALQKEHFIKRSPLLKLRVLEQKIQSGEIAGRAERVGQE